MIFPCHILQVKLWKYIVQFPAAGWSSHLESLRSYKGFTKQVITCLPYPERNCNWWHFPVKVIPEGDKNHFLAPRAARFSQNWCSPVPTEFWITFGDICDKLTQLKHCSQGVFSLFLLQDLRDLCIPFLQGNNKKNNMT